jgi:sulfotransferase
MSFTVEKIKNEIIEKVECSGTHGYVKISQGNEFCVITEKFANDYLKRIKEMEVYEDDLWVVTWMKSGTTWSQEMLWLLNNDLDYERAKRIPLIQRYSFIE